jgi:hypothetical protein
MISSNEIKLAPYKNLGGDYRKLVQNQISNLSQSVDISNQISTHRSNGLFVDNALSLLSNGHINPS